MRLRGYCAVVCLLVYERTKRKKNTLSLRSCFTHTHSQYHNGRLVVVLNGRHLKRRLCRWAGWHLMNRYHRDTSPGDYALSLIIMCVWHVMFKYPNERWISRTDIWIKPGCIVSTCSTMFYHSIIAHVFRNKVVDINQAMFNMWTNPSLKASRIQNMRHYLINYLQKSGFG